MNTNMNVLVRFDGNNEDDDFDGLSYLQNELDNHGIAATLAAVGDVNPTRDSHADLVATLRDAVRLMPLGSSERATWMERASTLLAEYPR